MEYLIDIIVSLVYLVIFVLQLLMLARAILSWFPGNGETALDRFLFVTTEPIIIPVRILLQKVNFFSNLPIDLSFLVTYLCLSLLMGFLPDVSI